MPQPDVLYHYTSQAGLLGIIQGKKIWATNILFLNDSQEFNYSFQMLQDRIQKIEGKLFEKQREFIHIFTKNLQFINTPLYQHIGGIYVCSFSEKEDQLSQWRGYCPESGGFNIGFQFTFIEKQEGFELVKCEYNKDKQKKVIGDFLDEIFVNLEIYGDTDANRKAWLGFRRLAAHLKHPKFAEEKEWRLVFVSKPADSEKVKYRQGKSMLIPYIEHYLSKSIDGKKHESLGWIPEIYVGPTPNPDLSVVSLEGILHSEKVSQNTHKDSGKPKRLCRVTKSEIPYRAW